MNYDLRPITPDELPAFLRADNAGFNNSPPGEEDIGMLRTIFDFKRSLAAFDGPQIVATAGNNSFHLTLPGHAIAPVAGVTWVSVLPTYRRHGILRAMMGKLLDDAVAHGEAASILYSSESLIYGRFGFGIATSGANLQIDTRHAQFAIAPPEDGRVIMLDADRAVRVLPAVYDRARRRIVGAIARSESWWKAVLSDPERYRGGAEWSSRFFLAYESPEGTVEGYVTYRVKRQWEQGMPAHTARISDLITLTPEARAALWRTCLSLDLVSTVETFMSPVDEPLRWMLADPRRLRVTNLLDALWLRILDVPAALSARRYATEDALVVDVTDAFRPEVAGRYRIEGSPHGAQCRPTTSEADLHLSIADLGAVYLGGVAFSTLAQAGRVQELAPGALSRADAMFACQPAPWATTDF
ncbi:MAG TPA: GNAT family N-acetyltransferase [Chloroflexota bacterium]|jgi:predicted acetyltransferase|nr:GNAT family N-acetyltransferase [Chloroflexota bacterium]